GLCDSCDDPKRIPRLAICSRCPSAFINIDCSGNAVPILHGDRVADGSDHLIDDIIWGMFAVFCKDGARLYPVLSMTHGG
ncbi:hypothetical protein, partial [Sphingomonas sp. Leaf226]|uniref:hypothetical protein n=1 Tax=Sphingomonas sp. Leaf226 TaxID=1735691 RepID=UPI001F301567